MMSTDQAEGGSPGFKRFSEDYHDGIGALLGQVMKYAADSAGRIFVSLDGKSVLKVDREFFVRRLYVASGIEEDLVQRLSEPRPPFVLCGPQGSGKTSTLLYLSLRIQERFPAVAVVTVDHKTNWARDLTGATDETAGGRFRALLVRELLSQLFPTEESLLEYGAWCLAGQPDASDEFDRSLLSVDTRDAAAELCASLRILGSERRARIAIIQRAFSRDPELYARYKPAEYHFDAVVTAFLSLRPKDRVLLVFDNVDRLPTKLRPRFVEFINDLHNALPYTCGSIIAIRDENLRFPEGEPRPGAGGDILNVVLQGQDYPAVLMPPLHRDHITKILDRRFEVCLEICTQWKAASIHGLEMSPQQVHRALVDGFLSNKIEMLACGSIRNIVDMYCEFLTYLVELERRGVKHLRDVVERNERDDGHLRTVFFVWVATLGHEFGVPVFSTLADPLSRAKGKGGVCDLVSTRYTMLAALLSLSHKKLVTWGALVDRLELIGFDEDGLLGPFLEIAGPQGKRGKLIECSDLGEHPQGPAWESFIQLTGLGRELIQNISCKMGYVYCNALALENAGRGADVAYLNMSTPERLGALERYMARLALLELRILDAAREPLEGVGDTLFDGFAMLYGVDRRMLADRIFASAHQFYDRKHMQGLRRVEVEFHSRRAELDGGRRLDAIDLSRLRKVALV